MASRSIHQGLVVSAVLIAALYALQMRSPLRLNTDALVLLSAAESADAGHGFLYHGETTQYPPGYPAILVLLVRAQLFHSWSLVALNLLGLGAAAAAAPKVFRRELGFNTWASRGVFLALLLSYVIVKHATLPVADVVFVGFAMCALAAISTSADSATPLAWLGASTLVIATILLRRAGVTLLLPLAFVAWRRWRAGSGSSTIWLAQMVVTSAAVAGTIAATSTVRDAWTIVQEEGVAASAVHVPFFRLKELGELLLNVPAARVRFIPQAIFVAAGVSATVLVAIGAVTAARQTRRLTAPLYAIGCAGILFVWPTDDARFWIPVLPLMIAWAFVALRRLAPPALVVPYACAYGALGLAALGYSTWLSFSGAQFPLRYGDRATGPSIASSYCEVFQSCSPDGPSDSDAVRLLRKAL